jgi:NAD(P)H-hydrate epimerase
MLFEAKPQTAYPPVLIFLSSIFGVEYTREEILETAPESSMLLVSTEHMRRMEAETVESGEATWESLMEHAGWGVAQEALTFLGKAQGKCVLALIGPGNNGGDGLVVARHLHDAGARVSLYCWNRTKKLDQDANWQRCRQRDIPETLAEDDPDMNHLRTLLADADLIVDGLLGMGVSRPVTGELAQLVDLVNATKQSFGTAGNQTPRTNNHQKTAPTVLSIDVPTGIHSDTGAVMETAIQADITVATGLTKYGLLLAPGSTYTGRLLVADIGIPTSTLETIMSETITTELAHSLLPDRPEDGHKGTFGKVLVVAGSLPYPGAAVLATAAAARAGAGLVTLATARSIINTTGRLPEVTLLPLPESEPGTLGAPSAEELLKNMEGYRALLIGPGLGHEEPTRHFLSQVLNLEYKQSKPGIGFLVGATEREKTGEGSSPPSRVGFAPKESPKKAVEEEETASAETEESPRKRELPLTVLDADGLNMLCEMENWTEHLPPERFILTPHPGEMKRLLQVEELDADHVKVATEAAARWHQIVVLKGSTTIVAAPDGRCRVYADGNPALATAGTGDVLSGTIAALLAQGMDSFAAAVLGVYLHAMAGIIVREELGDTGTLASDLLPRLPLVFRRLKQQK